MSKKNAGQIFAFVIASFCLFILTVTNVKASELIWSLSATTDCSGQGGDGESFDALCYNKNGINSTISWMHSSDPAIHFDVMVGHQYRFSETTNFSGVGGDFISNYLTDGQGHDYGLGKDWICPTEGCYHDSWSKDFEATSTNLYFLQASGCSSSINCFTSNLSLTDLSSPGSPALTPQTIWSLSATTDCSGQGGDGESFDHLCFNTNGANSTAQIDPYTGKPTISIEVVQGHTYKFTEQTSFVGTGGDFISNYLTDGDSYDYGLGRNWICPTEGCYHSSWTKIFTAFTNVVLFTQGSGCSSSTNCFTKDLQLIDLSSSDTPTPHPTPTLTPTPSPTPTTIPVTKVFLIPGMGASWNADAILNCKPEASSDWLLAPYAEDIYKPIIQVIKEYGWTTLPFYYDWRKPISQNSEKLASFLDINSTPNEKVNLVGHSMGGLVGREYLEASNGGKLSSLLTVGTPHKGSALAYPPWAGGDVWNDNFLAKIAITLYLKHCGGITASDKNTIHNEVPSVKDLLPIEPYLQKIKTTTPYLPLSSDNQNDWLNNLSSKSWEVRMGYMAGTGFETLKTIQTKDLNKRDTDLGNWIDGKPVTKIFSLEGDGTVLISSAILPEASFSATINQTHTGLVNSTEGMAKILEFLGKPDSTFSQTTLNTNPVEPNSALIVIGYPANLAVTDQDGKSKTDKDGLISFVNPKSGSYKLNIIPKSNNTLLIVAQFLPNGDVKYKEYNLKGLGPKFKTVKFDLQNPIEDPLNYLLNQLI